MAESVNTRNLALTAVLRILEDGEKSHLVLRRLLDEIPAGDHAERAFVNRLVRETLENLYRIDAAINSCSKTKVSDCKPVIRGILRISAAQLLFMDGAKEYAVVSEAVKLTKKRGLTGLTGYVNGVLRSVARLGKEAGLPGPEIEPLRAMSIRNSLPMWIVKMWKRELPPEQFAFLEEGLHSREGISIRVNTAKITAGELKERLLEEGFLPENGPFPECLILKGNAEGLGTSPSFLAGLFYVQDIASMLPAYAARIRPGMTIVDVCAAPGGKALHAADLLNGEGHVTARDLTEDKVALIRENAARLTDGLLTAEVWDAVVPDPSLQGKADVVLADLPCSGLGILRKKPEIRYRVTKQQVEELAALQQSILTSVGAYVRPGGVLVYSTCTVTHAENAGMREWILSNLPFDPLPLSDPHFAFTKSATLSEGYLQLVPGESGCDGFYIAAFVRKED